jgi:hypothetical protein
MRALVRALTTDDIRDLRDRLDPSDAELLFHSLGLQGRGRQAQLAPLLRTRVQKLSDGNAHTIAGLLVQPVLHDIADDTGASEDDPYEMLREGLVIGILERWSSRLVRLAIEVIWHQGVVSADERDDLADRVEGASSQPGSSGAHSASEPLRRRNPRRPREVVDISSIDSALDALIGQVVGPRRRSLLDERAILEAKAALEELIQLDPTREGSWYHYGSIVARANSSSAIAAPTRRCRLQFLLGRLEAWADLGDVTRLTSDLDRTDRSLLEDLLAAAVSSTVAAFVLLAHLEEPREFARLAGVASLPFAGREQVVAGALKRATWLLDGGGAPLEAESLLLTTERLIMDWPAGVDDAQHDLDAEAARTRLVRVGCRRRRHDFVGAERLLSTIEGRLLDDTDRWTADLEAAFIVAEVADAAKVAFPSSDAERRRWAERLGRARRHLDAAVDAQPGDPAASALLGLLAWCEGDDAAASAHLEVARSGLAGDGRFGDLLAGVLFCGGVARLRLLEAGTDEGAYAAMATALESGYRPRDDDLVSAVSALEAHGSPHAGALIALAVRRGVAEASIAQLVSSRARLGGAEARQLARDLGRRAGGGVGDRFQLLDSALVGADADRDATAAEALIDDIEELAAASGVSELDELWAERLKDLQLIREVLPAGHAELWRIRVLRRLGQLDEARALARGLFHRATAGSLLTVSAEDLLDLLGELGLDDQEIDSLARLVRDHMSEQLDSAEPALPVRVLFVGGNETQDQYLHRLATSFEDVATVEWFRGWGSNWSRIADRVEAHYVGADAVVLMAFVRTQLGTRLRRTSGEHGLPWVACSGHGFESLRRSIAEAVRVVRRMRSQESDP